MNVSLMPIQHRTGQFVSAILSRPDDESDDRLRACVDNESQWRLLERLSPFDRGHHLRVHDLLLAAGHDDPDLLLAAALHDVGKADERGTVTAFHRSTFVLLNALSPELLRRAVRFDNWLGRGLFLAARHPDLGALLAREAGASERCCWLIANHHAHVDATNDAMLRALILADEEASR